MKVIEATNGAEFLVDDDDYEKVNQHKWNYNSRGYLQTRVGIKMILLSRFLLDCPTNMVVDHIDHNLLNNLKSNLRICTSSQNKMNVISRTGTSKYKGVCWYRKNKKWCATICVNYNMTFLGLFVLEEDAAKAYNKAALELFGEFAYLNEVN